MDIVFLLSPEVRGRFLCTAVRSLGCTYICLWSYLPQPSNVLVSMDGWFHENETGQPSSSSGSLTKRLFDAYRASYCSIGNQFVPGLAYNDGSPYIELADCDLRNAASMRVQQQFYQEAGIKTAVFMGCKSGEIELGMSAWNNMTNMQTRIQNMFAEDTIQQFQFGDQFPDQSRPSSSSSSLRSLSVGSPEYSSLVLTKATTPAEQAAQATATTIQAYSQYVPTPSTDDAAMTRAILAVLSSSSAAAAPLLYHPPQQQELMYQSGMISGPVGAFKPYDRSSTPAPTFRFKPNIRSQKMIKLAISISRRAHLMRLGSRTSQDVRGTTTNQLHHMISERKRRQKLNASFHELKMLLPPGSKKDKASVLANTRDYLNTLKAQISDLEEKNKILEMQLTTIDEVKDVGDSSGRVQVHIIRVSESSSETQHIRIRIISRVECDMISFVLHLLECLKGMRALTLKSVDASSYPPQDGAFLQATLTIQVKTSDWDEEGFKEVVTRAVDVVVQPVIGTP